MKTGCCSKKLMDLSKKNNTEIYDLQYASSVTAFVVLSVQNERSHLNSVKEDHKEESGKYCKSTTKRKENCKINPNVEYLFYFQIVIRCPFLSY